MTIRKLLLGVIALGSLATVHTVTAEKAQAQCAGNCCPPYTGPECRPPDRPRPPRARGVLVHVEYWTRLGNGPSVKRWEHDIAYYYGRGWDRGGLASHNYTVNALRQDGSKVFFRLRRGRELY